MSNNLLNSIYRLKDVLIKSKRIVFLTGSGISKESGIPTFRGKDGLWKKHDPSKLASFSAFLENPILVWEFYHYRQDLISKCHPNPAHLAISKIQQEKKDSWILTQNVDDLHNRAGNKNIIELHGNIYRITCINCGYNDDLNENNEMPPRCSKCKNILKPGVVLFEEPLPKKDWMKAIEVASSCNIMFIIGTSLNVSPVNTLPSYAKNNNAIIIEINPESTWLSKFVDFSLKGSASDILPKISDLLK